MIEEDSAAIGEAITPELAVVITWDRVSHYFGDPNKVKTLTTLKTFVIGLLLICDGAVVIVVLAVMMIAVVSVFRGVTSRAITCRKIPSKLYLPPKEVKQL